MICIITKGVQTHMLLYSLCTLHSLWAEEYDKWNLWSVETWNWNNTATLRNLALSDVKWESVFAHLLVSRVPTPSGPGSSSQQELPSYPHGSHSCALPGVRVCCSTACGGLWLVATMLKCIDGNTKQLSRADVLALRSMDMFSKRVCLSVHVFVYIWV